MPFIPENEREYIANGMTPETPGQLCYIEYVRLIDAWRKERRWTTAHNEFKRTIEEMFGWQLTDDQAARALAYFVFFNKHVMKYEDEKALENGDI